MLVAPSGFIVSTTLALKEYFLEYTSVALTATEFTIHELHKYMVCPNQDIDQLHGKKRLISYAF